MIQDSALQDTTYLPVLEEMGDFTSMQATQPMTPSVVVAHWNPSPHYSSRHGYRPEAIVIHIAEGPFTAIGNHFKNPRSKVSAHYGVSKTGSVDQYVHESQSAWHTGNVSRATWPLLKANVNPNWYTIGIEHEGFANDVWPEMMYKASAALVRQIAQNYGIPLDRNHIIGHREIYGNKSCPGYQVDLDKLVALAQDGIEGKVDSGKFHTVQRSETLLGIARRYNTTITILTQLNPEISDIDMIYVGQRIRLP